MILPHWFAMKFRNECPPPCTERALRKRWRPFLLLQMWFYVSGCAGCEGGGKRELESVPSGTEDWAGKMRWGRGPGQGCSTIDHASPLVHLSSPHVFPARSQTRTGLLPQRAPTGMCDSGMRGIEPVPEHQQAKRLVPDGGRLRPL